MRAFDYKSEYQKLLTPEIVSFLTQIHEQKGKLSTFSDAQQDLLNELLEIAKIQSTEASNRIEGIITTDDRLKLIVRNKTTPRSRSEREIAGYRDVLTTIHENYAYIPIRPGMILQLHRDLYKFSGMSIGGTFKNADNVIAETLPDGTRRVRFQPVPAWETPEAMDSLCTAINEAIADPELDDLLLIPLFILDFLCVHPFNDGNGRMSRLLTLLLLYRSGYAVGKYISIERLIADSKESYYEALHESSDGWHEGGNDPLPFVRYLLGVFAFTGFVDILRAFEAKKIGAPNWKWKLLTGLVIVALTVLLVIFGAIRGETEVLVYGYCISLVISGAMRIVSAFRKTAMVYIQ